MSEDSIRVLHVDDEPSFVELAAELLERADERLAVESSTNVQDALSRLEAEPIDCVVSDYDMARTTGIQFLETVRERYDDLPFILFTGKGSEEIASEAISKGVTNYLQKEYGTDQYAVLANQIDHSVESYRSRRALEERNRELTIYEEIFDQMRGGACLYDREGRFKIVNRHLAEFYETEAGRLEGGRSRLIEGLRSERDRDPFQALIDGERTLLEGETEIDGPRGGTETLSYWLSPLTIDGTVEGVVGIAMETTDRRERERELETLVRNLPGIVYRCANEPGWPMEVVRGDCSGITGYPAHQLEQGEVSYGEDLIHPADREDVWTEIQDAIGRDEPFELTYRIRTATGTLRWVWERGRLVQPLQTDERLLEGFITDITEQKERERRLQQAHDEYSQLFNGMAETAWVIGLDGDVLAVNDAAVTTLGYSREELVSMGLEDVDAHLDAGEIASILESVAGGTDEVFETVHRRKDGETVPVEVSASEITYRGQHAILSIARDRSGVDGEAVDSGSRET